MKRRFPEHDPLQLWFDTFRLVYSFGQVLVDRGWLGLRRAARLRGELLGNDQLLELVGKGKGLVLLTAHVGNWQTALAHICGFKVPVNSLMQYEQEAVAKHYFDLRSEAVPFKIINSDGFMGGLIESTAALQRGEVVTIMADRYAGGPYSEVTFLGDKVRLPVAAYSLAAATGAPVAILLAAKTGRRDYNMKLWDVFYPEGVERHNRQEDLSKWARRFAQSMEEYVKEYPYQWYNFYDFWSQ
jgi:predicted LPLAT superfamily acyltransferase